jgi:hypothetical protein
VDELWNGTTWSLQDDSALNAGSGLYGVSCRSATFCIAAGGLIARWNGHRWSVENASLAGFSGVSCTSTTSCVAVGTSNFNTGSDLPVAARRR